MPASSTRKAKRAKQKAAAKPQPGPKGPVGAKPPPPNLAAPADVAPPAEEPEEVNFLVGPDEVMAAPLTSAPPVTGKTVRTPKPLNDHIAAFQARNGRVPYQSVTNALWRVLLTEDATARRRALEEQRRTGLPAQVEPGPFFRAVARQLELMKEEEADWEE